MQHLIDIPDSAVWAITAAREAYNASLPSTITEMQEQAGEAEGDPPVHVPVQVANPALLATNGQYLTFILGRAVTSWATTYVAVAPPPEVPPVVIDGVPQEVTMRQAQQEMLYTDTILTGNPQLLDVVEQAIAAMPNDLAGREAKIAWAKSSTVKRTHPLITALKPLIKAALGLTDAEVDPRIDQLFIGASLRAA
jgi:hypothetical protein